MTEPMKLNALSVGESMTVTELAGDAYRKRRLEDLGFCPGSRVRCLYRAPLGDPTAYLIRGTVIALRHRDAEGVIGVGGAHGAT